MESGRLKAEVEPEQRAKYPYRAGNEPEKTSVLTRIKGLGKTE